MKYKGLSVACNTGQKPYNTWTVAIKDFDRIKEREYYRIAIQSTDYKSALQYGADMAGIYGSENVALFLYEAR